MKTGGRIRVLHFTNAVMRAGAEEHILTLLTRLDRSRFFPMLAAPPELIAALRPDLPPPRGGSNHAAELARRRRGLAFYPDARRAPR